ncbi:MAG: glycosyltransferase family 9 protein [Ignavibacteria bacterium]|nr:glycosyltransferase family 9 protein [Ignavibacteria bacterium]
MITRKNTLVIMRLDAIGDYVLFRNFIKVLRESVKFRGYKITLCGNIDWKDLAEKFDKDYIDEFIWIDRTRVKRRSEWLYSSSLLLQLHFKGFETLLKPKDLNSRVIEYIIKISGVKNIISADSNTLLPFENIINNLNIADKVVKIQDRKTVFQFCRNKIFFEGLTGEKISFKKPFFDTVDKKRKENYYVLFPGAGNEKRKWSAEKYAELCKLIREKSDTKIVICGSAADTETAEMISGKANITNIEDKTGKTDLNELVEIIASSCLLISNETCAVHIGASVNTNTVCISNGNHYGRFNPYPEDLAPFVKTIYPKEITDGKESFGELVKRFYISSDLDINTITVKDVFRIINEMSEHK